MLRFWIGIVSTALLLAVIFCFHCLLVVLVLGCFWVLSAFST